MYRKKGMNITDNNCGEETPETTRLIKGAPLIPMINLNNLTQCLCGITNSVFLKKETLT